MSDHFKKHVIDENKRKIGRNVVKYTNDASKYYKTNKAAMTAYKSGSVGLKTKTGGGFFSKKGLIRSFFYNKWK